MRYQCVLPGVLKRSGNTLNTRRGACSKMCKCVSPAATEVRCCHHVCCLYYVCHHAHENTWSRWDYVHYYHYYHRSICQLLSWCTALQNAVYPAVNGAVPGPGFLWIGSISPHSGDSLSLSKSFSSWERNLLYAPCPNHRRKTLVLPNKSAPCHPGDCQTRTVTHSLACLLFIMVTLFWL